MEKSNLFVNEVEAKAKAVEASNWSMYGRSDSPLMEFRGNGDIYIRGEKAMSNKEVANGLLNLFYGMKLPTDHINVRVLKPMGYYDDHASGETLHIKLADATKLIQDGYVEIVVNEQGHNFP